MKKVAILLVLFSFLGMSFSGARAEDPTRLEKLQNEIVQLEKKLSAAKTQTRKDRIQQQIAEYKAEIDKLQAVPASVKLEQVSVKLIEKPQPRRSIWLEAGAGGGALALSVVYAQPLNPVNSLFLDAGYAFGNGFSFPKLGVGWLTKFGEGFFWGLELVGASFSKPIKDVSGRGTVPEGANMGLGALIGWGQDPVFCDVGYNSLLGLTANIGYRIFL